MTNPNEHPTPHPMDKVPMPSVGNGAGLPDYSAEQLRAERIAAYELGRNVGLEDAKQEILGCKTTSETVASAIPLFAEMVEDLKR